MIEDIKDFYYEHSEGCIGAAITIFIIAIILFFSIPVHGTMTVTRTRWNWDIPVQEYKVCHDSQWYSAPEGAYNIKVKREIHHYVHVKTGKSSVSVPVYGSKYYYNINKWCSSYKIPCNGFDHKPHEAECNLPYDVSAPNIGDQRRCARVETYEAIGETEDKTVTYEISKEDWEKVEAGGKIRYKKFRFGHKIWDIEFIR